MILRPQLGPQTKFIACDADVVFYGGSAGGGKSFGLLLDAVRYMTVPNFMATIFRRTTPQILNAGGLWDTASEIYRGISGRPHQNFRYFPFGKNNRIQFSHLQHEHTKNDYQGAQIPYIGFDELTHFTGSQFIYMLSRNRSATGIRGKIRGTCNPDPDSFVRKMIDWYVDDSGFVDEAKSGVVRWFVNIDDQLIWADKPSELEDKYPDIPPKSFTFIRSSLEDNQILLDKDPGYKANLYALNRVDRARLLDGNWNIRESAGMLFRKSDFEIIDSKLEGARRVRGWDLAATETKKGTEKTQAETASTWMAEKNGIFCVEDVDSFASEPRDVARRILNTAQQDGHMTTIRLPQDPGQAGKSQAQALVTMLAGFKVFARPESGDKVTRAKPVSAQAERGNIKILRGPWNEKFLNQMEAFPDAAKKDIVDATSSAFDELTRHETQAYYGTY